MCKRLDPGSTKEKSRKLWWGLTTEPWGLKSGVMEVQPGAVEAQTGVMEVQPGAVEAQTGVMEVQPRAVEAQTGAV
jgi:hypothetical protein